jgi:hypothetical protein
MSYAKPETVTSPKKRWVLLDVLRDSGPGQDALAVGKWDGTTVLAMRWNGDQANPLGNPQSRGIPTWFIIPDHYYDRIIPILPHDKQELARTYLKRRQKTGEVIQYGDHRSDPNTASSEIGRSR